MPQLKTLQWYSLSFIVNFKVLIVAYRVPYDLASAFLCPCPHHYLPSVPTSVWTIPRTCRVPSSLMP